MSVIEILKPHNLEAYQEINSLLESGIKKIAIPRATGSGKTYIMGALAEKYNDDKKLVLEPTRPLLNSVKEKFDEFGIVNTDFITYQKLIRMSDEDIAEMYYKLIFLDEFHHGTAPVWGQKIDCLMKSHTDSIIFGTSATTVRNDGVNVVESLFNNNAIEELPLSTAIARKVLPCPHYITAIYRIDDEFEKLKKRIEDSTNSKAEKKEFYRKMQEMKIHFEKSYGIPLILNKYIRVKDGKYLVFCKNKKHLNAIRDVVVDWFKTAGIKDIHSYAVYSDYPEKEKDYKEFLGDNSDSAKILFSINMLNEGLHIEDISGVLMLRMTRSNLVYLQQLGRLLEAGNMDKYLLVFDFVNNFSSANDGVGLLREIKDAIAREKESDPDFDDSGFEDIDTYFVIDQILEVQEMFKEIEGRLQGDRNYWIKEEIETLKYYFSKIGAMGIVKQGLLPRHGYNDIKRKAYEMGLKYLKNQKYIPNKDDDQIIIENYSQYGKKILDLLPHMTENQVKHRAKQLGLKFDNHTWTKEEYRILDEDYDVLPIKELMKKLPNRSKTAILSKVHDLGLTSDRSIDWSKEDDEKLYLLYPELGSKMFEQLPNKTNMQIIRRIKQLGIKKENSLITKMRLIHNAFNEGVVISKQNQYYKNVNLYEWCIYNRKNFSEEELEIINQVIPNKKLHIAIKVVDCETKKSNIYPSKMMAARSLHENFHILKSKESIKDAIQRRISGQVTTPYKGRFMFYYATDEEVKKYLEDNGAC